MDSFLFNHYVQFLEHSAEWTGELHRLEITLTLSIAPTTLTLVDHWISGAQGQIRTTNLTISTIHSAYHCVTCDSVAKIKSINIKDDPSQ